MKFKATQCDPLNPNIIELGDISPENIVTAFHKINWPDLLKKMTAVEPEEIYFSPSFEVENTETKHGLAISAVGDPEDFEFYIFYKRPKLIKIKKLFSTKEEMNPNYTTDLTGQDENDVVDCLNALIHNDTAFLDQKIGA